MRLHTSPTRQRGKPSLAGASGWYSRDRLTVLPKLAEEFEGVNAGVVAVAPDDLVGVAARRRHRHGGERFQLLGLEEAERIGRLLALLTAAGAGTILAQVC